MNEVLKKFYKEKIKKITDEYVDINSDRLCLDGYFSSKQLKKLIDVLDEYNYKNK